MNSTRRNLFKFFGGILPALAVTPVVAQAEFIQANIPVDESLGDDGSADYLREVIFSESYTKDQKIKFLLNRQSILVNKLCSMEGIQTGQIKIDEDKFFLFMKITRGWKDYHFTLGAIIAYIAVLNNEYIVADRMYYIVQQVNYIKNNCLWGEMEAHYLRIFHYPTQII